MRGMWACRTSWSRMPVGMRRNRTIGSGRDRTLWLAEEPVGSSTNTQSASWLLDCPYLSVSNIGQQHDEQNEMMIDEQDHIDPSSAIVLSCLSHSSTHSIGASLKQPCHGNNSSSFSASSSASLTSWDDKTSSELIHTYTHIYTHCIHNQEKENRQHGQCCGQECCFGNVCVSWTRDGHGGILDEMAWKREAHLKLIWKSQQNSAYDKWLDCDFRDTVHYDQIKITNNVFLQGCKSRGKRRRLRWTQNRKYFQSWRIHWETMHKVFLKLSKNKQIGEQSMKIFLKAKNIVQK